VELPDRPGQQAQRPLDGGQVERVSGHTGAGSGSGADFGRHRARALGGGVRDGLQSFSLIVTECPTDTPALYRPRGRLVAVGGVQDRACP
jgi:hypothetical protein